MSRRDSLLAVLVACIWALNFVVIDWGMAGVPPLLFAAVRFTAVVLPAVFFVSRPRAPWPTVTAVGTTMSLGQFGLLYSSMHLGMSPGIAALVLQGQAVFTLAIAAVWLRERPTRRQVLGASIATAGLAIVGAGRDGDVPLAALLLCVAAALSWGTGNVIARRAGVASGLSLVVWSALVVPLPLLGLSLAIDGPTQIGEALGGLGWEAAASTLYTAGLASLVGYSIFNGLLARHPAHRVVPFILLVPPVAMLCAWALQGDAPSSPEAAGAVVVLAGVLITTRAARRPTSAPGAPPRHCAPTPRPTPEMVRQGGATSVATGAG